MRYALITLIIFFTSSSCNSDKNTGGIDKDFIYNGEFRKPSCNFDYLKTTFPTLNYDNIPTPQCASNAAYHVICEVYGQDIADNEKPYNISLINNEYWELHGTRKSKNKKMEGGVFHLFIGKNNAKIYRIWHDK